MIAITITITIFILKFIIYKVVLYAVPFSKRLYNSTCIVHPSCNIMK